MSTTAIIDAEGVVQNLILADYPDVDVQVLGHPAGWLAVDGEGGAIGDSWDGSQFVRPEAPNADPVPESITRAQGKAALIEAGLWDDVTGFVAGIEDPTEKALAEVALNDTQYWSRSSPFLNTAADALGMPPEMLDALFVRAAEILL